MDATLSAGENKWVKGGKLSGPKVICIISRSVAYQSRPYEYPLDNLHIN
jgi:hypothetical protein